MKSNVLHFNVCFLLIYIYLCAISNITCQINSTDTSHSVTSTVNTTNQDGLKASQSNTTTITNPTPEAQSQNPYVNTPGAIAYPGLLGQFLPTALNALNPAEQQLNPSQLQNASPQQLAQLRRLQQLRALQRQQQGLSAFPGVDLLSSFLPGQQNNALRNANVNNNRLNRLNNNQRVGSGINNGAPFNPYAGGLGQLLGLSPPAQNGIVDGSPLGIGGNANRNGLNNLNGNRLYGQPNLMSTASPPSANQMASPPEEQGANEGDGSGEDNGTNQEGENAGDANEAGDGNAGAAGNGEEGGQTNAADPSQDPDMKQFSNLQGGENFPSDLFPPGILSENDLKDIQKSMDEQAKKEAEEKQQQQQQQQAQDAAQEEGNNGATEEENGDTNGTNDTANGDDNGNTETADNANGNPNANAAAADAANANENGADGQNALTDTNQAIKPDLHANAIVPKVPATGYIANDVAKNVARGGTIDALNGYGKSKYQPPTNNLYGSLPVAPKRINNVNVPKTKSSVDANPYDIPLRSNVQYDNERPRSVYDTPATRPAYPARRNPYQTPVDNSRNYDNELRYRRPVTGADDAIDSPYDNRQGYNDPSSDRVYGNSRSAQLDQLYGRNRKPVNNYGTSAYDDQTDGRPLDDVDRSRSPVDRSRTPMDRYNPVDRYNSADVYGRGRTANRPVDTLYDRQYDPDQEYRYRSNPGRTRDSIGYSRNDDVSGRDIPRGYRYGSLGGRQYDADQPAQLASEKHKDNTADGKSSVEYVASGNQTSTSKRS